MVSGGGLFMVMERGLVAVVELSATWAVKPEVAAVVGVPAISPVEGVSDSPAGSEPLVIDQV